MSDYPLKELGAEFTTSQWDEAAKRPEPHEKIGMIIPCPNCGMLGGVQFAGTEYQKRNPKGPFWTRTGDTLETISLAPSVRMVGHFHSWVRNGKLCVDSAFDCVKHAG